MSDFIISPLRKECDYCGAEIGACSPFKIKLIPNDNGTATEYVACPECAERHL